MIFWNINKLKSKIINNELSEVNYFLYFFLSTSVGCVGIFSLMTADFSYLKFMSIITSGLILPLLCFAINQFYKTPHFIEKYFTLSFVVLVRCLVFFILFVVMSFVLVISIIFGLKFVAPEKIVFIVQYLKYFNEQMAMAQPTSPLYVGQTIFFVGIICLLTLKHYRDLCQKYVGKGKEENAHN